MSAVTIPLESAKGLLTVAEAATARKVSPRAVQRWISSGQLRAVEMVVGGRSLYFVQRSDLDKFVPKPRGAPAGNQHARKKPKREKSTKTRVRKESGEKSPNPLNK